jgi:hypothetical protein
MKTISQRLNRNHNSMISPKDQQVKTFFRIWSEEYKKKIYYPIIMVKIVIMAKADEILMYFRVMQMW